jgi:O-antigen/teichoic acid export membrane protein
MIARGLSLATRIKSHPFVRQISGMMLLTAVGQGLYVLAGPFIGRLYSPEQIGIFGLFVTVWTVLGLFVCGLYDLAIPAARDDDEARRLSGAAAMIGLVIGMVSGAGLSFAVSNQWFGLGIFPLWVGAIMLLAMLTQMAVLIGQAWAVRRNEVMTIGRANVMMNGLRSVAQVAGGLLSPVWVTMVASEIIARLVQAWRMSKSKVASTVPLLRWQGVVAAIREYRRYPAIFGPAFLLDSAATLLQTAMIGVLFGTAEMGQYFLMRRTLDLPVAFAFRSLSDLFFARQLTLSRTSPEKLRPFFWRSGTALAIVGLVGGAPLIVWGSELFRFFYGPNWGLAGMLAAIMVPAMVLNLAVAPVSRVFQVSTKAYLRLLPGLVNIGGALLVFAVADAYALMLPQVIVGLSITICAQYVVYFAAGYYVAGHVVPSNASDPAAPA